MRYRVDSRRRRPKPKPQPRELPATSRRRVVSAGGVVLRVVAENLEVLLISIKEGRVWSLPKGQVEIGERYPQTALREVKEETAIEARILASLGSIRYHFTVKDNDTPTIVTKEVHHFLMLYVAGTPQPQKEEVDGVEWVPVSEAMRRLAHQNERDTLIKALTRWEDKRVGSGKVEAR